MGFYGNKTSAIKSQFTFDKIYPNRKEMDKKCQEDHVYIGRFVLIDYGLELTDSDADYVTPVYKQEDAIPVDGVNGQTGIYLYSSSSLAETTKIKFESDDSMGGITLGDIVYTSYFKERVLYKCAKY